eukprot:m.9440 g.9440  ORF g.9440 m.9440 type:complete len:692 (+) comp4066_c0_seq1:115-2190(+)
MARLLLFVAFFAVAWSQEIKTQDGGITFLVEEGKQIGYQIGDEKIYFSDLPVNMREFTTQSFALLKMGMDLGSKESASLQATVDELKEKYTNLQASSDAVGQALKKIAWFEVRQDSGHESLTPGSIDLFADEARIAVRTFGFDEHLFDATHDVDGLFSCHFTNDDDLDEKTSAKTATNVVKGNSVVVISCIVPTPVSKNLLASKDNTASVALQYNGKHSVDLSFVGHVGADRIRSASATVTHIDRFGYSLNRTHKPIVSGYAFSSDVKYFCVWNVKQSFVNSLQLKPSYDTEVTQLSSSSLVCDKFPTEISNAFKGEKYEDIMKASSTNPFTVDIGLRVEGQKGYVPFLGNPSGVQGPFEYHNSLCVDGVKNGLEIGVDCGIEAQCGRCLPGQAKVPLGGACDSTADCRVSEKSVCEEGVCVFPLFFDKVEAAENIITFSSERNKNYLTGKFSCVFNFAEKGIYRTPIIVAGGSVRCVLPSGPELNNAKLPASAYTKGVIKTKDGEKLQPTMNLPLGDNLCDREHSITINVGVATSTGTTVVGLGDYDKQTTVQICWLLPGLELVSPQNWYHSDSVNKYGNDRKTTFYYGCDACNAAMGRYDFSCTQGYQIAEYGYQSHCNHKTHKGSDSVFNMVQRSATSVSWQQVSDNCGDPNEATLAVVCRKIGTGYHSQLSTNKGIEQFMRNVAWTN